MKTYIAANYPNRQLARIVAKFLENRCSPNLEINARWLYDKGEGLYSLQKRSMMDFTDIDNSDMLIALAPCGTGSSAEIAYAIAKNKPVIFLANPCLFKGLNDPNGEPLPTGLLTEFSVFVDSFDHVFNKLHSVAYSGELVHKMAICSELSMDISELFKRNDLHGWIVYDEGELELATILTIDILKKIRS